MGEAIKLADEMAVVLVQAIEASGFSASGPTNPHAAEDGEPVWVCNARAVLADHRAQVTA